MENSIILSELETAVYTFIVGTKEVEFKDIKEEFGDKGIGAVGKLKQKELVEIEREYTGKRRRLVKPKE